jgi:hypothetical protein
MVSSVSSVDAPTTREVARQHKSDLLRSLRLCTLEGIMAMPLVTMSLPVNIFMTALVAKAYALPKTTIGLISALPFIGNFLQIAIAPLLARRFPPKLICVSAASLHLLSWAFLGVALPWIPRDNPTVAGHWLVGWFIISSLFGAIAGVQWNAWVQEWVPYRLRGKFFGRRNGMLQISTTAFLLLAGWSLGEWDYAVPVFQGLIGGAVVMRVFSLRWQWISPTRARRANVAPNCHSPTRSASSSPPVHSCSSSPSARSGPSPPTASVRFTMCSCSSSSSCLRFKSDCFPRSHS